jgi:hypothetical protein
MEIKGENVRKVISGSGNRSDPCLDRGRLPCMTVDPLSCSATIKGGQAGAREPTFTVPTVPPQTLTTKTDQRGAKVRGWPTSPPTPDRRSMTLDSDRHRRHIFILFGSRYTHVIPML